MAKKKVIVRKSQTCSHVDKAFGKCNQPKGHRGAHRFARKETAMAKRTSKKKTVKKDDSVDRRQLLGKTSGKTVQEHWYDLFKSNFKDKLSDSKLAVEKKKEFPNGKDYTEKDIKVHRSMFNRGKLPWQVKNEIAALAKPLAEFDDDGNALPAWGSRSEAKKKTSRKEDKPKSVSFTKGKTKTTKAKAKTTKAKAKVKVRRKTA